MGTFRYCSCAMEHNQAALSIDHPCNRKGSSALFYSTGNLTLRNGGVFQNPHYPIPPYAVEDNSPGQRTYRQKPKPDKKLPFLKRSISGLPYSSLVNQPFGKRQHFQYGQVVSGAASNKLIYGSGNQNHPTPCANQETFSHRAREINARQHQRKWWEEDELMCNNIYDPFGKPGAGAPLKDDAGKVAAARTMNLMRTVVESNCDHIASSKFSSRPVNDKGESYAVLARRQGQSRVAAPSRYDLLGNVLTSKNQTSVRRPADNCYHPLLKPAVDSSFRNNRQSCILTEEASYRGPTENAGKQPIQKLGGRFGQDAVKRSDRKENENPYQLANNLWGLQAANTLEELDSEKRRSTKVVRARVHFDDEVINDTPYNQSGRRSEFEPSRKRLRSSVADRHVEASWIGELNIGRPEDLRQGPASTMLHSSLVEEASNSAALQAVSGEGIAERVGLGLSPPKHAYRRPTNPFSESVYTSAYQGREGKLHGSRDMLQISKSTAGGLRKPHRLENFNDTDPCGSQASDGESYDSERKAPNFGPSVGNKEHQPGCTAMR